MKTKLTEDLLNKKKIKKDQNNYEMNEIELDRAYNDSNSNPDSINAKQDNFFKDLKIDFSKFRSVHRPFGKFKRKLIFGLIFYLNILINIDHGAIPAATTILKRELGLDNVSLGTIGSLVYLGLVLGAISAGPIFSAYSSKWVNCIGIISSCFFLYFFTIAETEFPLALCRIGCGFFQVFCYIYFPVWVDQFGISSNRILWLTFLQLGVPVGTMIGYVMEAYFINNFNSWRACFYVQIILLIIGVVLFILTPDKFFSKNYKRSEVKGEEIEAEVDHIKSNIDKLNIKGKIKKMKLINRFENNKYGRPSRYSIFSLIDENDYGDGNSYFSILYELFKNKVYVFTMLTICCLLFVVTGIQFWISDYMQTVLEVDPKNVFMIFAVVSITGPTLGVLAGGYLIQKLGGYTNKTALDACFKISLLAALSGCLLPIIDIIPIFVILMWLLLFFGASIVPGLTGIMLSSTPEKTKEIAMSITHLCYNLLGYLPSPFLYGLVCKYTGGVKSRYGLVFILLWSYFGVFFLFLSKWFKNHNLNQNDKNINEKDYPFQSSKDTKDSSDDVEIESKKIEEKAEALTALYGRISNHK